MKYGHFALKKYMHKYGLKKLVDLEKLPGMITIDDMPGFVKAGFDTAAKVLEQDAPFSADDIAMLLEKHLWLEMVCVEAFAESIQRPGTATEEEADETPEPEPAGNLTTTGID